ncbi:MAG: winged helix-turn-helix domain-containing protein [Bacteroidota bacterium]
MIKNRCFVATRILLGSFLVALLISSTTSEKNEVHERIKISLREVGNQLLLSNNDSTSVILPVKKISNSIYRLEFQKDLSFNPDDLVTIVETSLKAFEFPQRYRVEVIQCVDGQVAYSYEMSDNEENTLIPCSGRVLPYACYFIQFKFLSFGNNETKSRLFTWILFIICLTIFGGLLFWIFQKKRRIIQEKEFIKVGNFQFYQDQNKLIKEAVEIPLSKKECELLTLLISKQNQVITREELTKKVWEDNGVIVGRSLDTFISKLRKKLSHDDSLGIENVHGVGYKLVVG